MAEERAWFEDGLQYACEGAACGDCCSGRLGSGHVWMSVDEMQRLADHLDLPFDTFTRRYLRQVGQRYSLIEKPNLDCVFYVEGTGCSVYEARPDICRGYPFWPKVIASRESWEAEAARCPGIGCGGCVSADVIREGRAQHPEG
jgi:Fe-S-cluster containining protein